MSRRVLFFGGNGHAAARLRAARAVLDRRAAAGETPAIDLVEVPYPGFEDRSRAPDLAAFLAAAQDAAGAAAARAPFALAYATGIGALFALALRARGVLAGTPLLLQGPVLWGIERRWMPRLARRGVAGAIPRLLAWPAFQALFVRRHLVVPPAPDVRADFFAGYARCPAAADLFRWCGPAWLRELEAGLKRRPEALAGVEVWWGGRDRVVSPAELRWTEAALGARWPARTWPSWGHYPMIDDPEGWARALAAAASGEAAVMIAG